MLIDFRSQQFSVDTPGEAQTQGALDDGPATEQPHCFFFFFTPRRTHTSKINSALLAGLKGPFVWRLPCWPAAG